MLVARTPTRFVGALAAASLYYGWRLAERPMRGAHDARFGSAGDYRHAGTSDER